MKAIFYMNNYCLFNTLMAIGFKTLQFEGVGILTFALFRNFTLLFFSSLNAYYLRNYSGTETRTRFLASERIPNSIQDTKWRLTQVRSLFGTLSFLLYTFNLSLIPITLIIIIFQTNPMWGSILGYIFNNEQVTLFEIAAMLMSFSAVLFVASARSGAHEEEGVVNESHYTTAGLWLGVFFCLCHAWFFAGVGVISRRLQKVHYTELMIQQSVQGIFLIGAIITG